MFRGIVEASAGDCGCVAVGIAIGDGELDIMGTDEDGEGTFIGS